MGAAGPAASCFWSFIAAIVLVGIGSKVRAARFGSLRGPSTQNCGAQRVAFVHNWRCADDGGSCDVERQRLQTDIDSLLAAINAVMSTYDPSELDWDGVDVVDRVLVAREVVSASAVVRFAAVAKPGNEAPGGVGGEEGGWYPP